MIEIKEYVGKNNIKEIATKTTKAVTKATKKVKKALTTKEKTNK